MANNPATYLDPTGYGSGVAGLSGAIDFCMDFCTGNWRIEGSLWAGVGYKDSIWGRKIWIGWGKTWSAKFATGNAKDFKVFNCTKCHPKCREDWLLSGSVQWVKEVEKVRKVGGKKQKVKLAVVSCELGASFSACAASVDIVCTANLLAYIPGAASVITALEAVGAEATVGIQGSIELGICAATGGGVAGKTAEGCLSGVVRAGWNPPRKKSEIPWQASRSGAKSRSKKAKYGEAPAANMRKIPQNGMR